MEIDMILRYFNLIPLTINHFKITNQRSNTMFNKLFSFSKKTLSNFFFLKFKKGHTGVYCQQFRDDITNKWVDFDCLNYIL